MKKFVRKKQKAFSSRSNINYYYYNIYYKNKIIFMCTFGSFAATIITPGEDGDPSFVRG